MSRPKPLLQQVRGSGLDSASGADLIQRRIALFARLGATISFTFLLVGNSLAMALHGETLRSIFAHRGQVAHLCGVSLATAVWLVCRRGRYSLAVLELIDAVGLVGICTAWGFLVVPPDLGWLHTGLLANMMTVLARAITVPSRAGRTLRLSVLAYASYLILVWMWVADPSPERRLPLSMGINLTVWVAAAVATATLTSRILYDLRRSVREANEIGQYALQEKLGAGGMGEVWRAQHRFLVRAAAVKLIRPELLASGSVDRELMLRRFEREARATAALRSPHTVQLYDFGQADDGTLFYVMEMLGGIDLEHLVSRYGPVPAERAVHILRQVCHSLHEAHQNGLIHRDVKPANIFVSYTGTEIDFAKVLDFGLVGLRAVRPGRDDTKLTAQGTIAATPAYAAPEIVLGEASYDHRVDIYAVGCVGFWLLTGKLVFEGDTPMKMMLEHARTPPPRPQARTELPIPPELERIILDCLEKDAARRPATAAELASRIREVKLPQDWTAERAERWWRTHLPQAQERPAADVLLSQESSPAEVRELRRRRAVRAASTR